MKDDPQFQAVALGAAALDKKFSGEWHIFINLNTLNIECPFDCILGQLYGSYSAGLDNLGIGVLGGRGLGFSGPPENMDNLTDIWKDLIEERRNER